MMEKKLAAKLLFFARSHTDPELENNNPSWVEEEKELIAEWLISK